MIDSQRGAKHRVGYNHLISNKREWNNCFIKNHQQILLDFADFAWLEQPEGNLMDAFSRVWYNGSYTIAAKPIKTLELHYTMIQFLIIIDDIPTYFVLHFLCPILQSKENKRVGNLQRVRHLGSFR